jgi:hypothetical protein
MYQKHDVENLGEKILRFDKCIEHMRLLVNNYQPLLRRYAIILDRHVREGHPIFPPRASDGEEPGEFLASSATAVSMLTIVAFAR